MPPWLDQLLPSELLEETSERVPEVDSTSPRCGILSFQLPTLTPRCILLITTMLSRARAEPSLAWSPPGWISQFDSLRLSFLVYKSRATVLVVSCFLSGSVIILVSCSVCFK
jgi:hypothetical protein